MKAALISRNGIGLITFGLFSALSQAGTVLVDQRPDFGQELQETRYRADVTEGFAWMEADFTKFVDTGFDQPSSSVGLKTIRIEIPGLSYDARASQVVFTGEGARVICASVSERRAFPNRKYWVFTPTGKCRLYGTRSKEGLGIAGTEITSVYWFDVYFEAQD